MKSFMDEDFLLKSGVAKILFGVAKQQPIFDYHCHLSPQEIYENKPFTDLAALWLGGDHYKWRVMRSCGIDERFITGNSSGYEKFIAWSEVLPYCIGNPLYHWTHLELQRFFDIDTPLNRRTADEIWEKAGSKIAAGGFTPREIIESSNVAALCTTDDPADSLEYHKLLAGDKSFTVKVLPAFRPDKAINIASKGFAQWVQKLAQVSGVRIVSFGSFKEALAQRVEFFASLGSVASDHGFDYLPYAPADEQTVEGIFQKALSGSSLTSAETEAYHTALMTDLAKQYHKHDMAMELHIGALRSNNRRMLEKLGPDTGFDSVGDHETALPLSQFLNSLEETGSLPKTILFNQNPKDNYVFATMAGNFQAPGIRGKMQYGTSWWFNDHIEGMRRQMTDLANTSVLGTFIGMVTDSRSFLSYPRHEYFRRILCDLLGNMVENGEYPADMDRLIDIVEGISFKNAARYFGIDR